MEQKSKKKIDKLILQLDSSSENTILNTLIEIRKNVMRSKENIQYFSKQNGIPKVVTILQKKSDVGKIVDVALSALGNLCMECGGKLRNLVKKANGIGVVEQIFTASNTESIQNRSARTLANLALDQENIPIIHRTDALQTLSKVLKTTETKENILTYSRAVRLFAKTAKQLKNLIKENIVLYLAKHLSNAEEEVKHSILRSLLELANICCSPEFASQILSSGSLPDIMSLLEQSDVTVSNQSLTLLHKLSFLRNIVPGIGAGEGITIISGLFLSESCHLEKNTLLSILCMCCKEAVTRVKIRNNGVLEIFLRALTCDEYQDMFDKVISALQCFVFDDESMTLLLKNGVVPILVKHFQRVADFETSVCPVEDLIPVMASEEEMKEIMTEEHEIFKSLYKLPQLKILRSQKMTTSMENLSISSQNETEDEDTTNKKKIVKYSIDSPTYVTHTTWEMDQHLAGETCKSTFQPESDFNQGFSPLSTVSYHSPDRCDFPSSHGSPASFPSSHGSPVAQQSPGNFSFCSSGCSTWSDLEKSPEQRGIDSQSTVNKNPNYGMVCSIPYTCSSPVKSESNSPELSPINSPLHNEEQRFSSCDSDSQEEDIDFKMEEDFKEKDNIVGPTSIREKEIKNDMAEQSSKKRNFDGMTNMSNESKKNDESSMDEENPSKKRKIDEQDEYSKTSKRCLDTEAQLLILFSRFSQMNDPSNYLITEEVICCMLDYINKVESPHSRAARFLSRLASNPLCFDKLFKMRFIILVYYKLKLYLYDDELSKLAQSNRCILNISDIEKSIQMRRSSDSEFSYTKNISRGPYTFLDSTDKANEECSSPEKQKYMDDRLGKVNNSSPSLQAKVGLTLLQDMCIQADSHFGRGEIDRLMYKHPDLEDWIPIAIFYIAWLRGMQDHYLNRLGYYSKVLDLVLHEDIDTNSKYQPALQGLMFLCNIVPLPTKCSKDTVHYTSGPSQPSGQDKIHCQALDEDIIDEVVFVIEGHKLRCCRKHLSEKSPLFEAMLQGQFLEASLNEVIIEETTFKAFQYLVHFLYNCSKNCDIVNFFHNCDKSMDNLKYCFDVLTLGIRYIVTDLQTFLLPILSNRLLTATSACHIFHFALLHDFADLADDCVACMTKKGSSKEKMIGFYKFMNGPNKEAFLLTLRELFKC